MSSERHEPIWLTAAQVQMLHAESLNLFGGLPGLRDAGLLESALARPRHLWTYDEDASPFDLAAAYGIGIAKNHAFLDGNKRTALLAIRAFLYRNCFRFAPDEAETVTMMEGIAAGTVDAGTLSEWVRANSEPR